MDDINIYDLHIETLKIIEREMERLHERIRLDNGDDIDTYHRQLSELHSELIRLSNAFSDKECV